MRPCSSLQCHLRFYKDMWGVKFAHRRHASRLNSETTGVTGQGWRLGRYEWLGVPA